MPRWEPDRARILAEVRQAQRPCLANQDTEDAAAARQVADRRPHLLVDSRGDETLERGSAHGHHTERRVPRSGE
jgi:hypothetical protein